MGENILLILIGLLFCGLFIWLTIKDMLNVATGIALLLHSPSPTVIALILLYASPAQEIGIEVADAPVHFIPFAVTFIMFLSGIYAFKKPKMTNYDLPSEQSNFRFVLLFLGVLLWFCACISSYIVLYSPNILGLSKPSPSIAVLSFAFFNCLATIISYFVSNKNTKKRPNLMRWIVFFITYIFFFSWPLVISVAIIYIIPREVHYISPLWAELNTINFLPATALLFLLSRRHIYQKT